MSPRGKKRGAPLASVRRKSRPEGLVDTERLTLYCDGPGDYWIYWVQ